MLEERHDLGLRCGADTGAHSVKPMQPKMSDRGNRNCSYHPARRRGHGVGPSVSLRSAGMTVGRHAQKRKCPLPVTGRGLLGRGWAGGLENPGMPEQQSGRTDVPRVANYF
jgi:hypothetical protein